MYQPVLYKTLYQNQREKYCFTIQVESVNEDFNAMQSWSLQEEGKLENVIARSALVGNAAASASGANVVVMA